MKTATWMSILLSGTIIAGLGIAYSAGLKTSASAHASHVTNERVDDVAEDIGELEEDFSDHVEKQVIESVKTNDHLHRIDMQLTTQTQILKRIERNDE